VFRARGKNNWGIVVAIIDRIFADNPPFHRIDTEVVGDSSFDRSFLPPAVKAWVEGLKGRTNWGISSDFAHYLLNSLKPGMTTIETGSGVSTLIFALGGASHTAVAPDPDETVQIRIYASKVGIDLSQVTFVNQPSEDYLPTIGGQFDIVFIDGKHTFPWPILDWHHTADRLKVGGMIMLDDTQLRSVAILCDFLMEDKPRWQFEDTVGGRTAVFRKLNGPIGDVAWHEHPWTALWKPPQPPHRTLVERAITRVKRKLGLQVTD
jgi:Methyltransferase domain